MKLITYCYKDGAPQLGAIKDEHIVNLAANSGGKIPNDMRTFLAMGDAGMALARSTVDDAMGSVALDQVKLLAPITNPTKVLAIGLNYMDHVRETGIDVPKLATMFCKFPSSIIGPGDAIMWREDVTAQVDYEAELAFVIGKTARYVPEADAFDYIAGYMNCHDVSARDLQMAPGDQWIRGKSLDTFCPLGPFLATKDEIADPHNLSITCTLNGETMQNSNTKELIFKIPYLIEYLSKAFTLLPGDVVITGTPDGVGAFRKPPIWLKDGDSVTVEVEGLGQLTNPCVIEK